MCHRIFYWLTLGENVLIVEQTDTAEKEEANEDKEQDLVVKNIDCHVTENAQAHHTNLFQHVEKGLLIVRRGQKFEITVALNRPFDILKDQLCLTFQTGKAWNEGIRLLTTILLT